MRWKEHYQSQSHKFKYRVVLYLTGPTLKMTEETPGKLRRYALTKGEEKKDKKKKREKRAEREKRKEKEEREEREEREKKKKEKK